MPKKFRFRFEVRKKAISWCFSDILNLSTTETGTYRIFVQHLALSPNEYLTQYRINQACVLLRSSPLSIGEIAGSVGFEDQLYFSRVFKKIKGVPPSHYARKIAENTPVE